MSNELRQRAPIARIAAGIVLLLSAAAYGSTVTGTVTDAATGIRLPSVIVRAYAANGTDPGLLATTDSNGKYILGLPPGDYRILAYDQTGVYATSFAGDADSFETSPVLNVNGDVTNYNFALRVGGRVTGRVIGGAAPARQAVVTAYNLSGTRRGFTLSDAFGDYSIILPPGSYKLVAYDQNKVYAATFYRFASSFSAATVVDVDAGKTTQAVDFILPRAGRITGFVVDANTGGAVTGMLIEAYNQSGERMASQQMAADQFDLALPAGTYRLVIADLTHLYAPVFYGAAGSFEDSTAITVGAGELRAGLRFEVIPAGHISGRTLSESGEPLAAITVAAYNLDGTRRTAGSTNANGEYHLDVPPGPFKVVAYDDALVYASQFYALEDAFRTATVVGLVSGQTVPIDFRMELGGIVTGVVRDASSNAVVPSIVVAAYNQDGDQVSSATTNSSGEYRLLVPAGAYRLAAFDQKLRYATAYVGASAFEPSVETAVAAGATVNVAFQISTGVLVTGAVTDSAQRSVSGVEIAALDVDGNRVATAHSRNGTFELVLLPGTYKFLAEDPQHRYTFVFYQASQTLAGATPLSISGGTPPPSVAFVLAPAPRRRASGH